MLDLSLLTSGPTSDATSTTPTTDKKQPGRYKLFKDTFLTLRKPSKSNKTTQPQKQQVAADLVRDTRCTHDVLVDTRTSARNPAAPVINVPAIDTNHIDIVTTIIVPENTHESNAPLSVPDAAAAALHAMTASTNDTSTSNDESLWLKIPARSNAIDAIMEVPTSQPPGSLIDISDTTDHNTNPPLPKQTNHAETQKMPELPSVVSPTSPTSKHPITLADTAKTRKPNPFYLRKRNAISITAISSMSLEIMQDDHDGNTKQVDRGTTGPVFGSTRDMCMSPASTNATNSLSTIALQSAVDAMSLESCNSTTIDTTTSQTNATTEKTHVESIEGQDNVSDFDPKSYKWPRKGSAGIIKLGSSATTVSTSIRSQPRQPGAPAQSQAPPSSRSATRLTKFFSGNLGTSQPAPEPSSIASATVTGVSDSVDLNSSVAGSTVIGSITSSNAGLSTISTSSSQSSLAFSYGQTGKMKTSMSSASIHGQGLSVSGSRVHGTGSKPMRTRAESSSQVMKGYSGGGHSGMHRNMTGDSVDSIAVLEAAMAEHQRQVLPPASKGSGYKVDQAYSSQASLMYSSIIRPPSASSSGSKAVPAKPPSKQPTITKHQRYPSAYDFQPTTSDIKRVRNIEDLYVIRKIASGGFADVFLVRSKIPSGRYYALKAVKKSEVIKAKLQRQIVYEKQIMETLHHSFVVELYHTFQSRGHLFFVLEYIAGGDLYNMMKRHKRFTEMQARFYAAEVTSVFGYLHSMGIIYRDLKPENILLDPTGHIKLADFGFAKKIATTTSSFCGTPDYIAPEVIEEKQYSKAVDWWAIGVLIFELVSGKTPFRANNVKDIYRNVLSGRIQWVDECHRGHVRSLINALLCMDTQRRLGSINGIIELQLHPWFSGINWDIVPARGLVPPIQPHWLAPSVIEKHEPRQEEALDELLMEESTLRNKETVNFDSF